MGFEIYSGGHPKISFSGGGSIVFNKPASILFKGKKLEYVLLLWDKEKNCVGLRPIKTKEPQSYKIYYSKKSENCHITAHGFQEYINLNGNNKGIPMSWDEEEQAFVAHIVPIRSQSRK